MNRLITIRSIFSISVGLSLLAIIILIAIFTIINTNLQQEMISTQFEAILRQQAETFDAEFSEIDENLLRLKDLVTTFEQDTPSLDNDKMLKRLELLMAQNLQFNTNQYNSYFAFEKPKAQKYFHQDGYIYTVHKNPAQLNTEAYGKPENRVVEVFTDPAYQTNPAEVWYHIAKRSQGIEISPIYYDATYMKTWLYTVGTGFYENGKFEGMVGIDILVESLFNEVEIAHIGETGGLFLAESESGLVLTKIGNDKFLNAPERLKLNLYDSPPGRQVWSPLLHNDTAPVSITGLDGQAYLVSSRRLSHLPVTVVAYGAKRELLAAIYTNLFMFIAIGVGIVTGLAIMSLLFARRLTAPINTLIMMMEKIKERWTTQPTVAADAQTDLTRIAVSGTVETKKLGEIFNSMVERLEELMTTLEQRVAERTATLAERTAALEKSTAEREHLQQEIIEAQQRAIAELSTPVIPVMEGIIVLPLIGSIDSLRARDVTRSLLAGITQHRARVVILDVTGVSLMDTGIVNHLNKTIQAARLKGAQTIITGVSDSVAEAIVDLGIDWSGITTLSDLQSGLMVALDSLGIKLTK